MSPAPLGRFEVVSHPEIFDGVKVKAGQPLAVIRYNAAAILSCERVDSESDAAHVRHRDADQ